MITYLRWRLFGEKEFRGRAYNFREWMRFYLKKVGWGPFIDSLSCR